MNKIIYPANERGHADHGWLNTYHSFSFANYYNPDRLSFGKLRVLNDDTVAPGKGFGMHPHKNMEIITIPLSGALEHKDSMDNTGIIKSGEIQIMSAGKGIYHSEFNHSKDEAVELLQIWVIPDRKDVEPRYDQISWDKSKTINTIYTVISPGKSGEGSWIYQDAWFSLAVIQKNFSVKYTLNKTSNGLYLFVIDGDIETAGERLGKRDAIGLRGIDGTELKAKQESTVLLMEVPMN